ncbi:MAG: hypothetical protein CMH76_06335 [Nitrospinae bacterium]|nr:hypothetical protein [Nitrospinota bacterium]
MSDEARLHAAADKSEILEVAMRSHVCRDTGDWDTLKTCFHPDGRLTVSWFSGNAHDFIESSRNMMGGHHTGDSQKHFAGNPRVSLSGDRAVCEYYLTLNQRRTINVYEFDFQTWSSVVDLFERREGAWRVLARTMIYEKDRMDPHKPGEVPDSYFREMDLSPYPRALRYHCWRNEKSSGHPPTADIVIEGGERAKQTREAARRWLEGD